MNRKVPIWLVLLLLWGACVTNIVFGWVVWRIDNNKDAHTGRMSRFAIFIASFPHLVRTTFDELKHPQSLLIQPDLYPSVNGLEMEKRYVDSNYVLLSTYDKSKDQATVRLMRLSDQKIIHQWLPDFDEITRIFGKNDKSWLDTLKANINIIHPLISTDGSIVFHIEGAPLIKIDKDAKLLWVKNGLFHHSLEYDADGNIWSPTVIKPSKLSSVLFNDYRNDAIAKISPGGKVLFEKSVAEILNENGFRGLLFGVGPYERDWLHLNDIQPALTSTKYWMKGDVLISLRHKSTIFLYRPSTNEIVWLKTGPWLNQHDVDFIDSTRIGIFGNNIVRGRKGEYLTEGNNEEYIFDFKTNKIVTPYTLFLKKAKVSTQTGGRSDILPNGDIFIEETDKNRLLMGNTKDIIWQYVNRIDKHSIAVLSWSRFITKEEFKKLTFLRKSNTL